MAGSGDRALNATDWHTASGGALVVILFALSLAVQPSATSLNPAFTHALRLVKADRTLKLTVANGNTLPEITDTERLRNTKIDVQCGRIGVFDGVSDFREKPEAKTAARQQRMVVGLERSFFIAIHSPYSCDALA